MRQNLDQNCVIIVFNYCRKSSINLNLYKILLTLRYFIVWPLGTYGLPKPVSGCPANWQDGWIKQDLENSNPRSEFSVDLNLHMEATLTGGDIRRSFCFKTSTDTTKSWPAGKLYNVQL